MLDSRRLRGALLLTLLGAAGSALASADDLSKARFHEGEDAFRTGQFLDAVQAFEDAYRMSHKPEFLFNIGLSYRRAFDVDGRPEHLRRALDIFKLFGKLATSDQQQAAARNVADLTQQLEIIDEEERQARLRSGGGPPELRRAAQLSSQKQGTAALAQLDLLEKRGGNPQSTLIELYRLRGEIAADSNQAPLAEQAFEHLLALEPGFTPSKSMSAAGLRSFSAARAFWADHPALTVSHVVPQAAVPDTPVALQVSVENDLLSMAHRLTARYRRVGTSRFSSVSRSGSGDLTIPGPALPVDQTQYRVEYYIVATDESGNTLITIGSEQAPLSFPVLTPEELQRLKPRSSPFYASPFFWGGLAVAAGAAVAVVFAVQPPGPPVGSTSLKVVQDLTK